MADTSFPFVFFGKYGNGQSHFLLYAFGAILGISDGQERIFYDGGIFSYPYRGFNHSSFPVRTYTAIRRKSRLCRAWQLLQSP